MLDGVRDLEFGRKSRSMARPLVVKATPEFVDYIDLKPP